MTSVAKEGERYGKELASARISGRNQERLFLLFPSIGKAPMARKRKKRVSERKSGRISSAFRDDGRYAA